LILKHNRNTEIAKEIEEYLYKSGFHKIVKHAGDSIEEWCRSVSINTGGTTWLTYTGGSALPEAAGASGSTVVKDALKTKLVKKLITNQLGTASSFFKAEQNKHWLATKHKTVDGEFTYIFPGEDGYDTAGTNYVFGDVRSRASIISLFTSSKLNSDSKGALFFDELADGTSATVTIHDRYDTKDIPEININSTAEEHISVMKHRHADKFKKINFLFLGPDYTSDGTSINERFINYYKDNWFTNLTDGQVAGIIGCTTTAEDGPAEDEPPKAEQPEPAPEPAPAPEPERSEPTPVLGGDDNLEELKEEDKVVPGGTYSMNDKAYVPITNEDKVWHADDSWYIIPPKDSEDCGAVKEYLAINTAWMSGNTEELDTSWMSYEDWFGEYNKLNSSSEKVKATQKALATCKANAQGGANDPTTCALEQGEFDTAVKSADYIEFKKLLKDAYAVGVAYGCQIGRVDADWVLGAAGSDPTGSATYGKKTATNIETGGEVKKEERTKYEPGLSGYDQWHGDYSTRPQGDRPLYSDDTMVNVSFGPGLESIQIPIKSFLLGKGGSREHNARSFASKIGDAFNVGYPGSCIMNAIFDPGEAVIVEDNKGVNEVRYVYLSGGVTGSRSLGPDHAGTAEYDSAYGKVITRYNELLNVLFNADQVGEINGLFLPTILLWYYDYKLKGQGASEFGAAVRRWCGSDGIPWTALIDQAIPYVEQWLKDTPYLIRDGSKKILNPDWPTRPNGKPYGRGTFGGQPTIDRAVEEMRKDWESEISSKFVSWRKGGSLIDSRQAIIKNSSAPIYDRIMTNDPEYLKYKIIKSNSKKLDEDMAIREIQLSKIALNNFNHSTNDNELKRNNTKTTNFYDDIMKKYADDFLNTYLDDALQGLSKEYAGSFYTGLDGTYKLNDNAEEDKYSSYYNVHDETGADLIGSAHPKSINLADAMGNGGLVENAVESGNRMAEIARNTPSGNYRSKHAGIAERLNKLAKFAGLSGDRQSMKKINIAIRKFKRE